MSKNFINERNSERIDNLLGKLFKADTKTLFLEFQKFEKFKNKKSLPEILPFCFSSVWLFTVSKAAHDKIWDAPRF